MRPAFLATLAVPALVSISSAQISTGASAVIATRYVWRGITQVNGWVFQPALWVGARAGSVAISMSAWANLELRRAGLDDLTLRGIDHRGLGELDLDLAIARPLGPVEISAGWTRYTFHGDATRGGRGAGSNTSELFLRTEWRASIVSPSLLIACDIDRVRGCYLETGVVLPVVATPEPRPALALSLEPTAGWDQGQGLNPNNPSQGAHFAGNGLTHVDLPLVLRIQLPGTTVEPAISFLGHLQWSRDGATRITDQLGSTSRIKAWIEVGATIVAGLPTERRR